MGDRQQLIHQVSPLETMVESHINTLIVGGGIVGAGVLRDLSLHGVDCLLVDKKDFSSQTSQSSSKMLHGGIRYLENFDFNLVYEALHEKNLWLKLAPHLVKENRFYLPVFKDSLRPMWMVRVGIFLYDLLSNFQNATRGSATKTETIACIPHIRKENLKGSGIYSDAIVDDGKLTLEVIMDSLENKNAKAISYVSANSIVKSKSGKYTCTLLDELTGIEKVVTCDNLIIATGPFTDQFMKNIPEVKWTDKLLPSKGSHLWIAKADLNLPNPVVLTPKDGRVIFVIPHDDRVLIGTTEEKVEENFFDVTPSKDEIKYLIHNLNEFFPTANIDESKIQSSFAGIRPLVKEDDGANLGKTAREHKVFQPMKGLYVIVGGKLTTFRTMSQEITSLIVRSHNRAYNPDKTKRPLRVRCQYNFFHKPDLSSEIINKIIHRELPRTYDDIRKRRALAQNTDQKIEEYLYKHTI
ncbi:hypothetical protein A9Q84_12900 [Halobacteriovorax marinus]|uniref:FAD dependent oxidoreductase domain-containing protein n=1 Tax=Halobacteriovorax marinus TaxID=97084 RepID=A0A1Y5F8J4_9BACT|nr:hypothetical protein A9Q84_12900 [Halobacteriovorax marinus]